MGCHPTIQASAGDKADGMTLNLVQWLVLRW